MNLSSHLDEHNEGVPDAYEVPRLQAGHRNL